MSKKILMDIKPPTPKMNWPGDYASFKQEIKRERLLSRFKFVFILLIVLILIVGSVSFWDIYHFKNRAQESLPEIYGGFKKFRDNLLTGQSDEARSTLISLQNKINNLAVPNLFARFWGILIPQLENVPQIFDDLTLLIQSFKNINDDVDYLKSSALSWALNKNGRQLISQLQHLLENIKQTSAIATNLENQAAALGYAAGDDFSDLSMVNQLQKFLETLIAWLNQPQPHNLVVLFQNPSEIRPAGGFVGSYAEISLAKASLTSLKVSDIYDPDGQLDVKVVPPKPLQLITTRWGARDANWFFDYPTSAQKTLEFLEASKIYQERGIDFAAVIALNVDVIKSILEITGPINLPDYQLVIDKNNFLAEIQREVEAGNDKKAGQPKRILKILTPIFLEKLGSLSDAEKKSSWQRLQEHLINKDILFYWKDSALESYIKDAGLAGEVFNLPNRFNGDYLAVVNANIGGGKSDAFIKQKVQLKTEIKLDGTVADKLVVERWHQGVNQKDWWYRATNKNYLQVLVPKDSILRSVSGASYKKIIPPLNYTAHNYHIDTDTAAIESSARLLPGLGVEEFSQFGKKTFAGWLDIPAGASKKMELRYENPNAIKIGDGVQYQFVLDKQSGVDSSLDLTIEAPTGYKWKENDQVVFSYQNDKMPSRLILNLTLKKINRLKI